MAGNRQYDHEYKVYTTSKEETTLVPRGIYIRN